MTVSNLTLKELCYRNEKTLKDVSDITGISYIYLVELNTGAKKNPSYKFIKKISDVISATPDEVVKAINN